MHIVPDLTSLINGHKVTVDKFFVSYQQKPIISVGIIHRNKPEFQSDLVATKGNSIFHIPQPLYCYIYILYIPLYSSTCCFKANFRLSNLEDKKHQIILGYSKC